MAACRHAALSDAKLMLLKCARDPSRFGYVALRDAEEILRLIFPPLHEANGARHHASAGATARMGNMHSLSIQLAANPCR